MATTFLLFVLRYLLPVCIVYIVCAVIQLDLWARLIWRHRCGLSQVPGPRFARWSRLWIARALASGKSHEIWVEVNAVYGPVARIGPNHVITDDPEITRRILASGSGYRRGPGFDSVRIDPHVSDSGPERGVHKDNEATTNSFPRFTDTSPEATERTIDYMLLIWSESLRNCCAKSDETVCDIGQMIQFLTVDIVTKLFLGHEIGCIKQNRDVHSIIKTVETSSCIRQYLSAYVHFNPLLYSLARIPDPRRNIFLNLQRSYGVDRLMRIVRREADKYTEEGNSLGDALSSHLRGGIPREQFDSDLITSLVEGLAMTSASVQNTLLCIITNPQVYNTLCAEVRRAVARGDVSDPIQDREAKQCMYLQACVLEGLRRILPWGELREHIIPPGGDILGGFILPEGTLVSLNVWGLQLHAGVYGDNGKLFCPERWLTDDLDALHTMHQTHSLIFGHGATKCPGASVVMMSITKVIFEILRHFDVSIADPLQPWRYESHGILSHKDFHIRLKKVDYTHPPPYQHVV
ncbi:cytochrome P450 oxidoreductase [Xylaria cf. heliscus]|nr:cytochrome P450 oxidoreductase [Xylaria cf. heliscus]